MGLKVEGIESLKRQSQALASQRAIFNNALQVLVDDWSKSTKQTLTINKSQTDIKKLFKIKPLENKNKNNYQAEISISIQANKLSDYAYDQVRITTGFRKLKVERKRKEKIVDPGTKTYTRVKLLKASGFKQAKIPKGLKNIPDKGIKGFLYKKQSRVTANPSTPTGIYIRTSNKRYPLIMLRPVPLAYMINSKRIKNNINFDKRLLDLADILKKNL